MGGLLSFAVAFSAGCVFIGALLMICPDGVMAKPVKYILSLVFLLIIIASASGIGGLDFKIPETGDTEAIENDIQVTAAQYVYARALNSAGVNFEKITVCTDKSSDGSIVISKVIIVSDGEPQRIIEALDVAAKSYEVEIINE